MAVLVRFQDSERIARVGLQIGSSIHDITDKVPSITAWLKASVGRPQSAIEDLETAARSARITYLASVLDGPPIPNLATLTTPTERQDVWSVGVMETAFVKPALPANGTTSGELPSPARPALLFRAKGEQVVAPYAQLGMRKDSEDTVAEAVLALLLNPALEVVGYCLGTAMFARDIATANPLYVSQAAFYSHAVSLGPGFVIQRVRSLAELTLRLTIVREKQIIFHGEAGLAIAQQDMMHLTDYLGRCNAFPDGAVLLVGSGIAIPAAFSVSTGDSIRVSADGIGTLTNQVMLV